jgi:SAM-dependent methyltransferase
MRAFICPKCKGSLVVSGTGHACSACGAFYASRDGIALFGVTEEFYGELSLDEMKEFLALAEHGRFEDAVSSYLASRNPVLKDTILSPKRINWLQLFKVTGKEVVLDYGCGLGAVSFQLSKFVQEVIALDGCYERIRCLQIRAHQHHINNITLVLNGDPASLPIPSESVDLIVLSLVFIY